MIALVQETMTSSFIVVHEMNTHVHLSILNSALRGTDIFSGETTMY